MHFTHVRLLCVRKVDPLKGYIRQTKQLDLITGVGCNLIKRSHPLLN
jgi:hypothetical protein